MASGSTTTVRIRRADSERLQALAESRQMTVIDVLHDAVDALERQELFRGLSDDYRRLQSDPALWEAFVREYDSIIR